MRVMLEKSIVSGHKQTVLLKRLQSFSPNALKTRTTFFKTESQKRPQIHFYTTENTDNTVDQQSLIEPN